MEGIGSRIKEVRKSRSLTQGNFSKELNIKQATLSQVENDVIKPSLGLIAIISKKFGISVDWLVNGEKNRLYSVNIGDSNNFDRFEANVTLLSSLYQRLIDIQLMLGKLEDNDPEGKLYEFIDEFAITRNKYNDDLFLFKSGTSIDPSRVDNIKKMSIEEQNSYFGLLETKVNYFLTTFFEKFGKFYDGYMKAPKKKN